MSMNKGPTLLDGDLPVSDLGSCEVGNGQPRGRDEQTGARCLPWVPNSLSVFPVLATFHRGIWENWGEKRWL